MEFSQYTAGSPPGVIGTLLAGAGLCRQLRKGTVLHLQNDAADDFYYVLAGTIRSYVASSGGSELTLELVGPGNLFGESSYFTGTPRMTNAAAMTDLELICLDYGDIRPLLAQHPDLAGQMLRIIGEKVRLLTTLAQTMAFLSADKKIAHILVQLRNIAGQLEVSGQYSLEVTHQEIGDLVGIGRITVTRTLRRFEEQGWVALSYRAVQVLNPGALFAYATG